MSALHTFSNPRNDISQRTNATWGVDGCPSFLAIDEPNPLQLYSRNSSESQRRRRSHLFRRSNRNSKAASFSRQLERRTGICVSKRAKPLEVFFSRRRQSIHLWPARFMKRSCQLGWQIGLFLVQNSIYMMAAIIIQDYTFHMNCNYNDHPFNSSDVLSDIERLVHVLVDAIQTGMNRFMSINIQRKRFQAHR